MRGLGRGKRLFREIVSARQVPVEPGADMELLRRSLQQNHYKPLRQSMTTLGIATNDVGGTDSILLFY